MGVSRVKIADFTKTPDWNHPKIDQKQWIFMAIVSFIGVRGQNAMPHKKKQQKTNSIFGLSLIYGYESKPFSPNIKIAGIYGYSSPNKVSIGIDP